MFSSGTLLSFTWGLSHQLFRSRLLNNVMHAWVEICGAEFFWRHVTQKQQEYVQGVLLIAWGRYQINAEDMICNLLSSNNKSKQITWEHRLFHFVHLAHEQSKTRSAYFSF